MRLANANLYGPESNEFERIQVETECGFANTLPNGLHRKQIWHSDVAREQNIGEEKNG